MVGMRFLCPDLFCFFSLHTMMEDEDAAEMDRQRKELLNRFRNALKNTNVDSASWFDEDDLLDIFDFAGDEGDNYLRMEALLWGARFFPDSVKLRERRGVLYNDVAPDAVSKFTDDNNETQTLLTEIIVLRNKLKSCSASRKAILDLLNRYNQIEDEEAIQLVRLAEDTGNLSWLESKVDDFKDRIQFIPALLYEIGATAYDKEDYSMAVRVMKKLVEISPYNPEFWSFLADVQFAMGKESDGLDSLEMALAIAPDYMPAIRTKAERLVDDKSADADRNLAELAKKYPDDEYIVSYYIERRINKTGGSDQLPQDLFRELTAAVEKFPLSVHLLEFFMMYAPDKSQRAVERYYDKISQVSDDDEWRKWTYSLILDRWYGAALIAVNVLISKHDEPDQVSISRDVYVKALLYARLCKWHECLKTIERYRHITGETTPELLITQLMSFVRLHSFAEAKALAQDIACSKTPALSIGLLPFEETTKLSSLGMMMIAGAYLKSLSPAGIPEDADDFDPLLIFDEAFRK